MSVSGEDRVRGRRQDNCVGRGVVYVGDAKMTVSGEESCTWETPR